MVTFAQFGAGRIGRVHAGNVASHPAARLKYIVDPQADAARALAAATGALVADVETPFADLDVDAILIASSADTHADLILRAVAAKKAIFCEKPLMRGAGQARDCVRAIRGSGVPLFLAFQRRFDPSFAALKRRLAAGEIGRPEIMILTSRDPEAPPLEVIGRSDGLFRETMIHDFDVARWLLAEEPTKVHAVASCLTDPRIAAIGAIDTAVVTLETRSGAICVINNSWRAAYGYDQRVEVHGAKGLLQVGNRPATSLAKWDGDGVSSDAPRYFFTERYVDAYRFELDAFIAAVTKGLAVSPDEEDGLRALVLADCAQESFASGRAVAVPADLGI